MVKIVVNCILFYRKHTFLCYSFFRCKSVRVSVLGVGSLEISATVVEHFFYFFFICARYPFHPQHTTRKHQNFSLHVSFLLTYFCVFTHKNMDAANDYRLLKKESNFKKYLYRTEISM